MEARLQARLRLIETQLQQLRKAPASSASAVGPDILASARASCVQFFVDEPLWASRNRVHKLLWKEAIYAPLSVLRKELKAVQRSSAQVARAREALRSSVAEGMAVLQSAELAVAACMERGGATVAAGDVAHLVGAFSLLCIYQGDLGRYVDDLPRALERYHLASLLEPGSGYSHNQLSVAARELKCRALSWFHYSRAEAAAQPFAGVQQELAAVAADVQRTHLTAVADARIARLGSIGSRELLLPGALLSGDRGAAGGTHVVHARAGPGGTTLSLDLDTLLCVHSPTTAGGALPLAAVSVAWVLERVVHAAAVVRFGCGELSSLPLLTKQTITDVERLLSAGDAREVSGGAAARVPEPLPELSSMWLVRLVAIAVYAFHCASSAPVAATGEGAASSRGAEHALILAFELTSCVARHCRGLLLQAGRSQARKCGDASSLAPATSRPVDVDGGNDGDGASCSSHEEGSRHDGAAASPRRISGQTLARITNLLASVAAFSDWARNNARVLQGPAELSPASSRGERPRQQGAHAPDAGLVTARRRVLAALSALANALRVSQLPSDGGDIASACLESVILMETAELQGCPVLAMPSLGLQSLGEKQILARALAENALAAASGRTEASWVLRGSGSRAIDPTSLQDVESSVLAARSAKIRSLLLVLSALPGCRVTFSSADGMFRTSVPGGGQTGEPSQVAKMAHSLPVAGPAGARAAEREGPASRVSAVLPVPASTATVLPAPAGTAPRPDCPALSTSVAMDSAVVKDDLMDGETILPLSAMLQPLRE